TYGRQADAGGGFEPVAPRPLAGGRFARYEETAQLVAHAVDGHNDAVVDLSKLARKRRRFDFDNVSSAMRNRNGDALRSPNWNIAHIYNLAVAPNGYQRGAFARALVLHAIRNRLRLTDNAEPRRRHQGDAAVALVGMTGDEGVNRRGKAQRRGVGGDGIAPGIRGYDEPGQ